MKDETCNIVKDYQNFIKGMEIDNNNKKLLLDHFKKIDR